jgi:hypothetical protein
MGTPPEPPAPPPAPAPPAPPPPTAPPTAPPSNGGPPSDLAADVARLTAALEAERRRAAGFEGQVTKLRNAQMSDHEKAIDAARAEGRTEAVKAAGLKLAAAEFRAAAAGKLADPGAALALLDLSQFVKDDGEVDTASLSDVVGKLVAQLPPPAAAPGRVPAGPQGTGPTGEEDFFGAGLRRSRGGA